MFFLKRPASSVSLKTNLLVKCKRIALLVLLLQCVSFLAYSQSVVKGKVVDENNEPVVGATVQLKNAATATTTDASGDFTLTVPSATGVLVFSSVGYTPTELPVSSGNMNVQLKPLNNSLDEVVVVGYSTQKRVSVTGAVDKINAEAIEGKPVANLSQALQGVSPNLIIQQRSFEPGQGLNINIRGLGTLGNNDPLVVIDGIVGGDINLLNPADIENISVLKDAGTAAIYHR